MAWRRPILWPNMCPICARSNNNNSGVLAGRLSPENLYCCPQCNHTYEPFAAYDMDTLNGVLDPLYTAPEVSHTLGEVTDVDNVVA